MTTNIVDLRGKLPVHSTFKYSTRKLTDIRSIAIHHSLTFSGSAEAFAGYHVRTNGWPGIGYAYVIGRDGTVYQCWDPTVVSYHVGNSNKHALGICLVGDFRTQEPTPDQYAATVELVQSLRGELPNATKILGHSEYPDYSWKACPVIDMDDFRAAVAAGEDEDQLKLQQWQWKMIGDALDAMYKGSVSGELQPAVLTDYTWVEKAYRGELTMSELLFLNTITGARGLGIQV